MNDVAYCSLFLARLCWICVDMMGKSGFVLVEVMISWCLVVDDISQVPSSEDYIYARTVSTRDKVTATCIETVELA